MKVLVTGGSGYLGTHVRRYFNADDFSRRSGFDVLRLQDAKVVANYDVVIHMAAHLDKSPDAAEQVFLTNVEGTINLLREMREDAAFIFISTKDVYGRFADNFREVPETCQRFIPANRRSNGQNSSPSGTSNIMLIKSIFAHVLFGFRPRTQHRATAIRQILQGFTLTR